MGQKNDRSGVIGRVRGQFVDKEMEREFRAAEFAQQYLLLRNGLGVAVGAFCLAIIADILRLDDPVDLALVICARLAVAAAAAAAIWAAREPAREPLFGPMIFTLAITIGLANVIVPVFGDISWQDFAVTVVVEVLVLGIVIHTRPLLLLSAAVTGLIPFVIFGAATASIDGFIRSGLLLVCVSGVTFLSARQWSIAARRGFIANRRSADTKAQLRSTLDDLQAQNSAVKKAAEENVALLEELDAAKTDAEAKAEFLRIVLDSMNQGIAVCNANLRLAIWNKRFVELLRMPNGFARRDLRLEDIIRHNARAAGKTSAEADDIAAARIAEIHAGGKLGAHRYERSYPDGRILDIEGMPLPDGGMVTTFTDVTESRQAEKIVHHMALHDSLTGLKNRRGFLAALEEAAAFADKEGGLVALALFDLDGFKLVNDEHGHPIGDAVLKAVSEIIKSAVRTNDCVARLGGDEFAAILPIGQDVRKAEIPAERVLSALAKPIVIEDKLIKLGVSIGLGFYPTDCRDLDELLTIVDHALYSAKESGKGRLVKVAA